MGKQKKKQKKRGNPLWTLVFLAALAVFCFSGYKLIGIYLDYKTGTDEYRDLQQYTTEITKTPETPAPKKTEEPQAESEPAEPSEPEPEPLSYPTEPPLAVDFESLKAINPDVKGWLYIEALDISYPVVQGPDNDAYLHTTYEGTSNFAGSIFLDYQNQVFLAALAVFCFSGYKLIGIYLDYKTGTDEYRDLQQYTTEITKTPETPAPKKTEEPQAESEPAEPSEPEPEPLSYPTEPPLAVDFESLKAINPDVKGWLYIEALDISYPVVQGPDNDAYLHTTYEGTSNFAGSIFLDYQNQGDFSDGNTIVYGHNMKNLSMFGKLKQMKEQEKYRDSVYFWMLTPESNDVYQIFSAFYTEADSDVYTLYSGGGEAFVQYLNTMAARSEIPVEQPEMDENSHIIVLSTCAASDTTGRFVVLGVRRNR